VLILSSENEFNLHVNEISRLALRKRLKIILPYGRLVQAQITEEVGLSPQMVSNIVNKFLQRGTYLPGKPGLEGANILPLTLLN